MTCATCYYYDECFWRQSEGDLCECIRWSIFGRKDAKKQ